MTKRKPKPPPVPPATPKFTDEQLAEWLRKEGKVPKETPKK